MLNIHPYLRFAAPLTLCAGLFIGCSSEPTCDYSDAPYMEAQSVPPLQAPGGLSAPDRSGSLTIPATGPNAPPPPSGKGRCLDRPPSYFSNSTDKDKESGKDKK